jgi:hypothetical protein
MTLSAPPKFHRATSDVWCLDSSLPTARRRRLLSSPSFESIVASLRDSLSVEQVKCDPAKSGEKANRIIVKLRTNSKAIDLFHNSVSGYRAQYLKDAELGEAANRFALDELWPHVLPLILSRGRNRIPTVTLEQSLLHPWAKLWIHQGLWLRYARREHRVLRVAPWQSQLSSQVKRSRKLTRWGCLAPEFESAFVIKGGFVYPNGLPRLGTPPKDRAADLHSCGFT